MGARLGLDAVLYRNNGGTFAAPVWVEIDNVRDLGLNLSKAEADVTTRGNNGWRALVGTLKTAEIEFEMVNPDVADADLEAIRDAFMDNTDILFAVADDDITTPGTQYFKSWMQVFKYERAEPLEGAQLISTGIKPTYNTDAPDFITVP